MVLTERTPAPGSARRQAFLTALPPAAVLLLAATADVSREAATWFGVRGPICPLGHLLGECACPGCGLTRGVSLVVQGHFRDALAVNPAGFVVAALCIAAILLQFDVIRRGRVTNVHLGLRRLGYWCFLAGVLLSWATRALGCLPQ